MSHAGGDADLGRAADSTALRIKHSGAKIEQADLCERRTGMVCVQTAVGELCSGDMEISRRAAGHLGAPWRLYLIPVIPCRPKLIEAPLADPAHPGYYSTARVRGGP